MLVGAAIGSRVKNFGAIFVIATLLHFLFDRLPHLEYFKKIDFDNVSFRDFTILFFSAFIDLSVGLLVIWVLLTDSIYSSSVFGGIFISILPDGLVFLYAGMRLIFHIENKLLKNFYLFHNYFHISKNNNSLISGFIIEGLIGISSVILILYAS